jgi:hypothetical protein
MLEFEYFEKFKTLGKSIAYSEMVNTILELKDKYIDEAGIKRSFEETKNIIETLDMVSNIAIIKGRENLEKC